MKIKILISIAILAVELSSFAYERMIYDSVNLCGEWEMAYTPKMPKVDDVKLPTFNGERGKIPAYWEDLPQFAKYALPYKAETFPMRKRTHTLIPGQIKGMFYYRRTIELKDVKADAYLAFELVRNNVRAWVNGKFIGRHSGFLTPFEMAIPNGILKSGANEIVLAVDNDAMDGLSAKYKCGGGTTSRAIFMYTGGIDGRFELRFAKSVLNDLYVTTAKDLKTFNVHLSGTESFQWKVLDNGREILKGVGNGDFSASTKGMQFWSPENPKRYTLELKTKGGVVSKKFGLRRFEARGEKLYLNDKPVYLRGVCDHCYYAKTMHLPMDIDYYRMVVKKRKECGFNFVRFHTYLPPEAFFEAMDELGYLVHVETPHNPSPETYAEVVAFARKHPCAVIYCAGNEDSMKPILEAALEKYAEAVHTMSDGLFSPISALRNAEYSLSKDDYVVKEPFPHNPKRLAHYASFCDLFTSFQLGYVSYDSLNSGSAELLDKMGDAYCGKPRLSHEICIDGSYVDFSTEKLYPADSPFLKTGIFDGIRKQLKNKGLMDRADTYYRNSCEWMWRIRKYAFEKLRGSARTQGYDFLGDINTHWHTCGYSVGLFDEFYRMKPGESAENVRRYNSAAVIMCDLDRDFVFTAGDSRQVGFKLSNYDKTINKGKLRVSLVSAEGKVVTTSEQVIGKLPVGEISKLTSWDMILPKKEKPAKYYLKAEFRANGCVVDNQWEIYAFPSVTPSDVGEVKLVSNKISKEDLLQELERGSRVVLFGRGPFNFLPTNFRIGLAGRSSGNYATVIQQHPIFKDFPHEGYCGWQFYKMLSNGFALQLEGNVPFDPIVDIASSVKVVIKQAIMFEYRVGKGRLLVCGFSLQDDDVAGQWLKNRIVNYAASKDFEPRHSITAAQLKSVIEAPIVTGKADTNRANDTNAN